jgi:hypothetical protein
MLKFKPVCQKNKSRPLAALLILFGVVVISSAKAFVPASQSSQFCL